MKENQEKKANGRLKKRISQFITIACVAVLIYSIYGLAGIFMEYYENRRILSEAQDIYQTALETKEAQESEHSEGEIRPQFDALRAINPDIIGWVAIEDTPINYPILQSADNDYYLTRNYEKETTRAGSIFLDYRNNIAVQSPNIIVYGHRMKDGSMFNSLTKYLNKDFFDRHRIVEFDTLYESYDAEVFAVYNTTTDFDYIQTDFNSVEEYQELLDEIQAKSKFHYDIELDANDQIITLSTCDYLLDPDKGRLVVHAKLIKKS